MSLEKTNRTWICCSILLLFLWFIPGMEVSAGARPLPEIRFDSTHVNAKSIPVQRMERYLQSSDFNYLEKQPKGNTFWQYLLQKLKNSLGMMLNKRISEILFHIVFIGIFILLLVVLFGGDIQSILVRNKSSRLDIPVISDENIDNLNFDKIIKTEIDHGNYNIAVRYLYLKLLQSLTVSNLIIWQKEKTNRDYFRELVNSNYSIDFRTITSAYEYVWYGKFPLDQSRFEGIHQSFNDFFKRLNG